MKPQHLNLLTRQVDMAVALACALRDAEKFERAELFWELFLDRVQKFFNKLRAATKGDPQLAEWGSQVLRQRDADPLMFYLHEARHAQEHGVEPIVEDRIMHRLIMVDASPPSEVAVNQVLNGASEMTTKIYDTPAKLVRITTKKGIIIEPPQVGDYPENVLFLADQQIKFMREVLVKLA